MEKVANMCLVSHMIIHYNSTKLRSRVCFYTFFLYKIGRERTEEEKGREESVARITSHGKNTEVLCEWNLIQKMCCLLWRKTREGRYLREWTDWIFPTPAWRCTCILDKITKKLIISKTRKAHLYFTLSTYTRARLSRLNVCMKERTQRRSNDLEQNTEKRKKLRGSCTYIQPESNSLSRYLVPHSTCKKSFQLPLVQSLLHGSAKEDYATGSKTVSAIMPRRILHPHGSAKGRFHYRTKTSLSDHGIQNLALICQTMIHNLQIIRKNHRRCIRDEPL